MWQKDDLFGQVLPLFEAGYESVSMMKWLAKKVISNLQFYAGVEYYVVEGSFSDTDETYHKGSWLCLPAGSEQTITVHEDCLVLQKTGHLLNPVSYD